MTKEECIALLNRYAEYNGIGIPKLAGCRDAMRTAAELLQQPSLPYNLDEAADTFNRENAARMWDYEGKAEGEIVEAAFKAGAEWMAGQGVTREVEVKEDAGGYPYIDKHFELYDYDKDEPLFKAGDKVVVQIRKK